MCPTRTLHDGWDYRPDWRLQLIEDYLIELAAAKDQSGALQAVLWREPDPYVRQGLRFRFTGTCTNRHAIAWAFLAVHENPQTGLASRIRAAVIADRYPEEIAEMLNVEPAAVVAFEKVFFDTRRYLGAELWLETLVQSAEDQRPATQQAVRESIWLRTALHEGWAGLERLWFRKSSSTDAKSLDGLAREIEGIAARRALRHLQQLEETGAPVSDDDIKRLAIVSRRSMATAGTETENTSVAAFFQKMLDTGAKNILQMEPEGMKTKALQLVMAERMGLPGSAGMPARRRMRALNHG